MNDRAGALPERVDRVARGERERPDAATPVVSVGMPVYNSERLIRRGIESVLNQTYRDFELVICDNASTDSTEKICREYAARDRRVRYYRNPENIGLNQNYNLVRARSRGRYFKWASSNDACAPTLIERCVEVLEARPDVSLCYARTLLVREDGTSEPYDDNLELSEASPFERLQKLLTEVRLNNAMNGVIRRSVLDKTAQTGIYLTSDIVLIAEIALRGKFVQLPEFLFYRSMTAATTTSLKSGEHKIRYFDPKGRDYRYFQHWRAFLGYLSAAARAPMSAGDRARTFHFLFRQMVTGRRELLGDLSSAFRTVARV